VRENALVQDLDSVDELICSALRGERPAWPAHADAEGLLRRARMHGVPCLLHARMASSDWPGPVLQQLRTEALHHAMWELRHQQLLAQALAALNASGVQPVLIKGTSLAYSLYSDPSLRSRADTDLIIAGRDRTRTHELLLSLGYRREPGVSGEHVSYQASYSTTADGASHTLDLHWKISNSALLSRLFSYEEFRREARPLPALCPDAWGPDPVHALLLACMHRAQHRQSPYYVDGEAHYDANRLVWLYDIHLLALQFDEAQWAKLVALASAKGLRYVCRDGLHSAATRLHTPCPPAVMSALAAGPTEEAPARYFHRGDLGRMWMNFLALQGLGRRVRFARELLFPPAAYMHERFGAAALPWLYLRRAWRGLLKRVAAPHRASP